MSDIADSYAKYHKMEAPTRFLAPYLLEGMTLGTRPLSLDAARIEVVRLTCLICGVLRVYVWYVC
jgi:hypothetical protein